MMEPAVDGGIPGMRTSLLGLRVVNRRRLDAPGEICLVGEPAGTRSRRPTIGFVDAMTIWGLPSWPGKCQTAPLLGIRGRPKEKIVRAVTVSDYGASPVVMDLLTPVAGPGQIRIKLAAAGMNPMDASLASGEWRPAPATFPMVLGVDGAGTVDSLGEGVTRFSLGERIFGQLLLAPIGSTGTYAEYVAVTAEAPLAAVPKGLDLIEAAPVPTVGGTGLTLVDVARAARGQDGAGCRGRGRSRILRHPVRRHRGCAGDRQRACPG